MPVVPIDPSVDLAAFASQILAAFQTKNWALLIAFALIALVAAGRKWGAKVWPFLSTGRGGALLSIFGGLALAIASAAAVGGQSVLQVVGAGVLAAVTASGTYALVKKLIFPTGADAAEAIVAAEPAVVEAEVAKAVATEKSAADILGDVVK